MTVHATQLREVQTGVTVEAELHDELALNDLFEAEKAWNPVRFQIIQDLLDGSVPTNEWPTSLRWNWADKAAALSARAFGPLGAARIFGIQHSGVWQGIMLGVAVGHVSKANQAGRDLVYVEYLESAPWNWAIGGIEQRPRFQGCGKQLLYLGAQWSKQLENRGRVGLHSLRQSEVFYREKCGMTDCGEDPKYSNLRYFEFSDEQATVFMKEGES